MYGSKIPIDFTPIIISENSRVSDGNSYNTNNNKKVILYYKIEQFFFLNYIPKTDSATNW